MDAISHTRRVNGLNLHMIEAGPPNGPLVILLHGFPDFWWGWRHQIGPLAARGFRVIVPDGRGYNLSDKPPGLDAYHLDALAADVAGLADACGRQTFRLVGHDWGGVVAFWTAHRYPQRVERMAIINAPHPDVWRRIVVRHLGQAMRSYYVALFQLPRLPEAALRGGDFVLLRTALVRTARPGSFTPDDLSRYRAAWLRPGAMTGMLNYYRALRRQPSDANPPPVRPPTLLIWGVRDATLHRKVAEASLALCERGEALFLEDATHWPHLDAADVVNAAVVRFLELGENPPASGAG